MTHQAWDRFQTEDEAKEVEIKLGHIESLSGEKIMELYREGSSVFFNFSLISVVEDGFKMRSADPEYVVNFAQHFYLIGQVNKPQHNRNGCFWGGCYVLPAPCPPRAIAA